MLSQAQLHVLHCIGQRPLERLWELPHSSPAGCYVVSLQRLRLRGLIEQEDGKFRLTQAGREAVSIYTPPV